MVVLRSPRRMGGDIVEQGDHDALLEAGGAYDRLYWSQFAGGVDPGQGGAVLDGSVAVPGQMAAVTAELADARPAASADPTEDR